MQGTTVLKCPKSRTALLGTTFPVSVDQQRETKAQLEQEHHISPQPWNLYPEGAASSHL